MNGRLLLLACLWLASACSSIPAPSAAEREASKAAALDLDLVIGEGDALLVGAGDIAACGHSATAQATGDLIRLFPSATVFTTGDNAYLNGTTSQFTSCYEPVWGSFKDRTRPSPGNHDYGIYPPSRRKNAVPYFQYFGDNAGFVGMGYYSYDLGGWHIVSLNSMAGAISGAPKTTATSGVL